MEPRGKGADSLSVIVPVYNSEAILPKLIERLEAVLASLEGAHEIVLVNDASKDGSWNIIRELCARYPGLSAINLMRNYGQHNALLCGIRAARRAAVSRAPPGERARRSRPGEPRPPD